MAPAGLQLVGSVAGALDAGQNPGALAARRAATTALGDPQQLGHGRIFGQPLGRLVVAGGWPGSPGHGRR